MYLRQRIDRLVGRFGLFWNELLHVDTIGFVLLYETAVVKIKIEDSNVRLQRPESIHRLAGVGYPHNLVSAQQKKLMHERASRSYSTETKS